MRVVELKDRMRLEAFLRRDPGLHLYALGDLDDAFWPRTRWFGLEEVGGRATSGSTPREPLRKQGHRLVFHTLREVILLYDGGDPQTLLALTRSPAGPMQELLHEAAPMLPERVYAHLSPGLEEAFAPLADLESHGLHLKLMLAHPERITEVDTSRVERLGPDDLEEVDAFYRASYPETWFDPRTLSTGYYFGLREGGVLLSVAGIHVISPGQRVAALGNVATHPKARGRGLARQTCARLCQELSAVADHIGANVHVDNKAAIACYRRLGFEKDAEYGEWMIQFR